MVRLGRARLFSRWGFGRGEGFWLVLASENGGGPLEERVVKKILFLVGGLVFGFPAYGQEAPASVPGLSAAQVAAAQVEADRVAALQAAVTSMERANQYLRGLVGLQEQRAGELAAWWASYVAGLKAPEKP